MLRKTSAHITSDNQLFLTLEAAKIHELELLLSAESAAEVVTADEPTERIKRVTWIINNLDAVKDILTTKPHSRPSARAFNGGKKARKKAQAAAVNAELQDGKQ